MSNKQNDAYNEHMQEMKEERVTMSIDEGGYVFPQNSGISLRNYLANNILIALLGRNNTWNSEEHTRIATHVYSLADEMIKVSKGKG